MLKSRHIKRHKLLLSLISIALLVFFGTLGSIYFIVNQAVAQQRAASDAYVSKMDKKIAELKKKKELERIAAEKAKKEAERKRQEAAKKKAAADAALKKQLQGKIVTPSHCAVKGAHSNPTNIDVIVNKKHCLNPINYVPSDLSSYQGFIISAKIQPHLIAMFNAAAAAKVPISMTSSYRSYDNQVTTYNHWVAVNGSYAAADTVSARPGYSEHQTGFAVDLSAGGCSLECFRGTGQYTWMKKNAYKYGFVERYQLGQEKVTGYSPEAWHWRYVGITTATTFHSSGSKSLEQYWGVEGGGY